MSCSHVRSRQVGLPCHHSGHQIQYRDPWPTWSSIQERTMQDFWLKKFSVRYNKSNCQIRIIILFTITKWKGNSWLPGDSSMITRWSKFSRARALRGSRRCWVMPKMRSNAQAGLGRMHGMVFKSTWRPQITMVFRSTWRPRITRMCVLGPRRIVLLLRVDLSIQMDPSLSLSTGGAWQVIMIINI